MVDGLDIHDLPNAGSTERMERRAMRGLDYLTQPCHCGTGYVLVVHGTHPPQIVADDGTGAELRFARIPCLACNGTLRKPNEIGNAILELMRTHGGRE